MQGLLRRHAQALGIQSRYMMATVHNDDAVAALTAEPGVYNIVDGDPLPVADWLPAFARWVNAPEPPRLSVDNALKCSRLRSRRHQRKADRSRCLLAGPAEPSAPRAHGSVDRFSYLSSSSTNPRSWAVAFIRAAEECLPADVYSLPHQRGLSCRQSVMWPDGSTPVL